MQLPARPKRPRDLALVKRGDLAIIHHQPPITLTDGTLGAGPHKYDLTVVTGITGEGHISRVRRLGEPESTPIRNYRRVRSSSYYPAELVDIKALSAAIADRPERWSFLTSQEYATYITEHLRPEHEGPVLVSGEVTEEAGLQGWQVTLSREAWRRCVSTGDEDEGQAQRLLDLLNAVCDALADRAEKHSKRTGLPHGMAAFTHPDATTHQPLTIVIALGGGKERSLAIGLP
ncbi:hypothetical protein [Nocardiopsis synnemataformans]|uniref:hypothetical protein n=1 Tax=Nocardiopsis synnemataformans TaxID=61305 RepID=UPI003EB93512